MSTFTEEEINKITEHGFTIEEAIEILNDMSSNGMIGLKRIKNSDNLKEVIISLLEDIHSFKFLSNSQEDDVIESLEKALRPLEWEE